MFSRANTALVATVAGILLAGCEPSREDVVGQHQATVAGIALSRSRGAVRSLLAERGLPVPPSTQPGSDLHLP